ncbi:transposase family protein [Frankia sp. R82]|uniref:transposase family protein n=1 Tax=Frankia sp. R82 TaxID=2950553 RepID=UPI00204460B0|nr:transposase family protein [Frankia sp. R82]MCM3885239.1 transposase family protein [Frankia sp. R82]
MRAGGQRSYGCGHDTWRSWGFLRHHDRPEVSCPPYQYHRLPVLDQLAAAVAGGHCRPSSVSGLLTVFGRIADPREPRGRRHGLAVVLTLATCAVLAGARSFAAI